VDLEGSRSLARGGKVGRGVLPLIHDDYVIPTKDRASVYPEGKQWRCGRCDFTCDDSGPDFCPDDGGTLTRMLAEIRLPTGGQ